jgi:hypothetical protein
MSLPASRPQSPCPLLPLRPHARRLRAAAAEEPHDGRHRHGVVGRGQARADNVLNADASGGGCFVEVHELLALAVNSMITETLNG